MWQRGCFPTKTLAWPRRLYRMRDRCAVLRTLLQCVCTQRRNCIGQLSPFSEYAPTALRNKWKPAATIKLIHYRRLGAKPHESSAWRISRHTMPSKVPKPRCDAQLGLQIPGAANRAPPSGVSRRDLPKSPDRQILRRSLPLVGHFLIAHLCSLIEPPEPSFPNRGVLHANILTTVIV